MKHLKKLLFATALFVGSISFMNAQSNVAHIDTQALIDAMPKAIEARGELEKLAKTYEADIRTMATEYQNKLKQYDAEASTKTDEENTKRAQEVGDMRTSIEQYQGQAQQDLATKEKELFEPIYKEVRAAIEKVGKEQGFQYILDSREGSGTLLLADGKDLLADVKKELGF
jgi:outer membrane protein